MIICVLSCQAVIDLGQCDSRPNSLSTINHDVVTQAKSNDKFHILGVFGRHGKNSFDVFRSLLEELARRSHDMTVISYFPRDNHKNPPLPNYRDINLANGTSDILVNNAAA